MADPSIHRYGDDAETDGRSTVISSIRLVEGMQLGLSRNLLQAVAVLVSMFAGAVIGYVMMVDWRIPAALSGAVLGMIGGTFVSGLVLMFVSPKAIELSREEAEQLLARTERRAAIAWKIAFALLLILPAVAYLATVSHPVAFVTCLLYPLLAPAFCLYPASLSGRVKQLRQALDGQ